MRRVHLAAFSLLLTCALGLSGCSSAPAAELTVHVFSAGAADAILLFTPNAAVLIDCGERDFGKQIVQYLSDAGIEYLDYLILTHFDKDHVGGAAKVLNALAVGQVLVSDCPRDSDEYEKYEKALNKAKLTAQVIENTLWFDLDGVSFRIGPPMNEYEKDESNNSSLIVAVTNGDDRLLFMGDAERERIDEFLAQHWGRYDFLKVPHHGRSEKNSAALFQSVRPKVAVITSSKEEPEDTEVVKALRSLGAQVFLTREGAVTVQSSGHGLTVQTD